MRQLLKNLFGSRNQRLIKKYRKTVDKINALEPAMQALSIEELRNKTQEFKDRFKQGESLDSMLPEAFAVVRETSVRLLGLRHFDVQLIGGMVLHEGKIAEMSTGEGKTLVATLPAYLNALSGNSVHVVTVNDYLARRDAGWMGPIYETLGLTIGVVIPNLRPDVKRESYEADIIYATNNELGFDYLRNKMAFSQEECLQKDLSFAIVDEVDSILIDEARTPLIISGAADDSSDLYLAIDKIIPKLTKQEDKHAPGDFHIDEKHKQVYLSEEGHEHAEQLLAEAGLLAEGESLYNAANLILLHHLNAALRAHACFKINVDYLIKDNQVVIVDEHTGRTLAGRRWSDGLHQAVEAKEGVKIQSENQTLASITFQNFFRLYDKISGMTGTADTEAFELHQIYGLEVVVVPTNKPCVRLDYSDVIYLSQEEKFEAIIKEIKETVTAGRPTLVGTISIETSEFLSKLLTKEKIKHQVLNAKFHEQEASIVAEAGRPGAVTIATNMAGRGTDIVLGGNLEAELRELENPTEADIKAAKQNWQERHAQVIKAGGLHIIGTERHESRRIDNQLRGRSGRQGDPGSSRFYLSLEDNLMRIFATGSLGNLMRRLGVERGEAITHPWVTRSIENAQRKVEGHNFDIRKQLLDYDNVANDQRTVIYAQRDMLMQTEDISENIKNIREIVVNDIISEYIPPNSVEDMWNIEGLENALNDFFLLDLPVQKWLDEEDDLHEESLRKRILDLVTEVYQQKETVVGDEVMRRFEKAVMLNTLDSHWKDHLAAMDHLRHSIGLRGYAQKDPKQEYKREAFNLFTSMLDSIRREVIQLLSKVEVADENDVNAVEDERRKAASIPVELQHQEVMALGGIEDEEEAALGQRVAAGGGGTLVRNTPKIGRNDPCPCGSNKKYKQCHGKIA